MVFDPTKISDDPMDEFYKTDKQIAEQLLAFTSSPILMEKLFDVMRQFEMEVTVQDFKKYFDHIDATPQRTNPERKLFEHPQSMGEHLWIKFQQHNCNSMSFFYALHPVVRGEFCYFISHRARAKWLGVAL